jgi:hypothetical protein
MGSVVDFGEVDGRGFGFRRGELVRLVMIFPILIAEFKLGASFYPQGFFSPIELLDLACAVKALIVTAFIEGDFFLLFPLKQGVVTIGAVVLGLSLGSLMRLEE